METEITQESMESLMTIHDDVRSKIFGMFNLKDICGELDNCLKMRYTINNKEISFTDGDDEYGNDIIRTYENEDYHMVYVVDCFGNKFYQVFNKKNLVEEL